MRRLQPAVAGILAASLLLAPVRALATNATNLTGHGAAPSAMGGTDGLEVDVTLGYRF